MVFTARTAAQVLTVCLVLAGANHVQAAQQYEVQFRLDQWKTLHFHDAEKAEKHYKAVKDLGCEVQKFDHNGHIDVKYRCPKWKVLKTKTDDEAHVWEKWLKSVGFATKHAH